MDGNTDLEDMRNEAIIPARILRCYESSGCIGISFTGY